MEFKLTLPLNEADADREVWAPNITRADAERIGTYLKVDWNKVNLDEFHKGLRVELEHADLTRGDMIKTAQIALAHLRELPDYYTRLATIEKK